MEAKTVSAENSTKGEKMKILVLGTGFAGTSFIQAFNQKLKKKYRKNVDLTAINERNYLMFSPLLYQVATGQVYKDHISIPVCHNIRDHGYRFLESEIVKIVPERNEVITRGGGLPYDHLVLSLGSENNDFGIEGVNDHAIPLKNLRDGELIRNRILESFRTATSVGHSPLELPSLLTYVIIGGGASGIELAGSLIDYLKRLEKDYNKNGQKYRVILLEGQDRLMKNSSEKFSVKLEAELKRLGVEILLNSKVARVMEDEVILLDGSRIPSKNIFWTAGVRTNTVTSTLGGSLVDKRAGRIIVDEYLRIPNFENIYVLGDNASPKPDDGGTIPPQTAAAAVQEGKYAGKFMASLINGGRSTPIFRYKDPGIMLSLGRFSGLCQFSNGIILSGFSAWFIWRFVHLAKITTFRNRAEVLSDWIFSSYHRRITSRLE
ncbi:MAG: NAD(P)/FAD-dependent oxidoreductase [Thermoplasmataceae archaeon]